MPGDITLDIDNTEESRQFYRAITEFYSGRPGTEYFEHVKNAFSQIPLLNRSSYDGETTTSIPLTTSSSYRGGFGILGWTDHHKETMTQYGDQLVQRIRKMAQSDGIDVNVAVLYEEGNWHLHKFEIRKTAEVPYNRSYSHNSDRTVQIKRIVKYSYN